MKDEKTPPGCRVNGDSVTLEGAEQRLLSTVLRKELGLCAAKVGCDNGECGSCAVLRDGEVILSCQTTWAEAEGSEITTTEGLSEEDRARYAALFADVGMACGFCIPGLVLRLHALLQKNPSPNRSALQSAMSRHLCRCTGYQAWLESVQRLLRPNQPPPQIAMSHRGNLSKVPRFSESGGMSRATQLLAGASMFVDDLREDDMLEAALAFVPCAWGRLRYVDTTRAEIKEGILSVLTTDELEQLQGTTPFNGDTDTIPSFPSLTSASRFGRLKSKDYDTNAQVAELVQSEEFFPEAEEEETTDLSQKEREALSSTLDESLDEELPLVDQAETSALINEAMAMWEEEEETTIRLPPDAADRWREGSEGEADPRQERAWLVGREKEAYCVGDVVALVVGKEREQAQDCVRHIRTLIDAIDPQFDAEYSFQRGTAHQVFHQEISRSDVEQAFRDAFAIVSGTWCTSPVDAFVLEPPSCLAVPLPGQRMKIYTSGCHPLAVQAQVAQRLGFPPEQIEVFSMATGGDFGARSHPMLEAYAAVLALREDAPVKLTLSREDASRLLPKRHGMRIHATLACDDKGNFTGLRMNILADTGGHAEFAAEVMQQALIHACGPYRITAYHLQADAVCSNNPSAGALESAGLAQVAFALEGAIDMLSERIDIDRWALRYRNALRQGERLPNGQFLGEDCNIAQALEAVRDVFYKNAESAGIACAFKGNALLQPDADIREARVEIVCDSASTFRLLMPHFARDSELRGLFLRRMAQASGLPLDACQIEVSSTSCKHLQHPATVVHVDALCEAIQEAAESLKEAIQSGQSLIGQRFDGVRRIALSGDQPALHPDMPSYLSFSYAAQVALLDPANGRIKRLVTACDAGAPLDVSRFVLQLEGAMHRGLGYALSEGLSYQEGFPDATQPDEFGLIPPQYMPHLQSILLRDEEERRKPKSKGSGEIALIPTAPALASAIYKLEGVRHFSLPMRSSTTAKAHNPPKPESEL